ncbi:MAG: hypothetical protein ACEQSB_00205 [Undibacterium sp.]
MSDPTPFSTMFASIQEEFNYFMIGRFVGEGQHRYVYEMPSDDKNFVYKIVKNNKAAEGFHNVTEYNVWHELQSTEMGKWLAPCHFISHHGSILVQSRTQVISEHLIPKLVPKFLTDCHKNNWGLYKGRPVLHDYGFLCSFIQGAKTSKLRMVKRENA